MFWIQKTFCFGQKGEEKLRTLPAITRLGLLVVQVELSGFTVCCLAHDMPSFDHQVYMVCLIWFLFVLLFANLLSVETL